MNMKTWQAQVKREVVVKQINHTRGTIRISVTLSGLQQEIEQIGFKGVYINVFDNDVVQAGLAKVVHSFLRESGIALDVVNIS